MFTEPNELSDKEIEIIQQISFLQNAVKRASEEQEINRHVLADLYKHNILLTQFLKQQTELPIYPGNVIPIRGKQQNGLC